MQNIVSYGYSMIEFKQYGLNQLWIHRYIPSPLECKREAYESLYIEGMLAAFYGLAISAAASLMAIGGEFVVWYLKKDCPSTTFLP